jgi:hypothetical protein
MKSVDVFPKSPEIRSWRHSRMYMWQTYAVGFSSVITSHHLHPFRYFPNQPYICPGELHFCPAREWCWCRSHGTKRLHALFPRDINHNAKCKHFDVVPKTTDIQHVSSFNALTKSGTIPRLSRIMTGFPFNEPLPAYSPQAHNCHRAVLLSVWT